MLPIHKRDNRWWQISNAGLRLAVLRGATRPFARNIVVNEYPKSGGSWLSQMLSEVLDLPFPRNRWPMFRSCIMQCHILNPFNMRDVVVVWRDGRDVMVSLYHHSVIGHEMVAKSRTQLIRDRLKIKDPMDVKGNLPRFIEMSMTDPIAPHFSWPDFVDTWHGRAGVVETYYENLLLQPKIELMRIAHELSRDACAHDQIEDIVQRYSFEVQSGRLSGIESKQEFLRKGIAGDWKNYFTQETTDIFNSYAGNALTKLGYEKR